MITRTHNAYHLGDNLVHLHFLRKVALAHPFRRFVHAAQWQYLKQLKDVIADVPNLTLTDFNYLTPPDSINAWRGDKQFWYSHEHRNDFVKFHVEYWFPYLASMMNVDNPIKCSKDMLFDYPAIKTTGRFSASFDVLVINAPPGSGQFASYNHVAMARIAKDMAAKGLNVMTTSGLEDSRQNPFTVTQIGHLSLHCHAILMVSTGPSWPTFNIWNQDTVMHRIILLEPERVNLSPNTMHCATIDEAAEVLMGAGLL